MKLLLKIESAVCAFEKYALLALVLIMVLLAFAQVLLRVFFSKGILWADPLLRHLVLWAGFFGAGLAARYGKHFSLDLVPHLIAQKFQKAVKIVNGFFAGAICLLLAFAALKFLKAEMSSGVKLFSVGQFAVPAVMFEIIIPAGFLLVLFHTIVGIFRPKE